MSFEFDRAKREKVPITTSAKKALRVSYRRTAVNKATSLRYKQAVKDMRLHPTAKNLQTAYSLLDRAVKAKIMHKNKSARLKSALSKLLSKKVKK